METPLFDALCALEKQNTLRMHMPGHKGRPIHEAFRALFTIDFTELGPTGNLYENGGAIAQAEALAARAWGCPGLSFCTNGSTGAIQAALLLACPSGSQVILERGCHKSVYHAAALLDLRPVYIAELTVETLRAALAAHPEAGAVCLTSPDYFGRCKDIAALSRLCRERGVRLIVDEAHGAHLPFMDGFSGAVRLGADLACASMHKTLPALGQCAVLTYGPGYTPMAVKSALSLTCTSSPSYPMMASMDLARAYMEGPGREAYAQAAAQVQAIRRDYPALDGGTLDPCRLTLLCTDGFAAARALEYLGIYTEMADERHLVLITTGLDSPQDFDRLRRGLDTLGPLLGGPGGFTPLPPAAPRMLPGQALRAKKRPVPLKDSEGLVCAQVVAPYPPATPVLAFGEEISQKHIAYLYKKRYNMLEEIFVVEPENGL